MKRHAILFLLLFASPYPCVAQMVRGWGLEGGASGGYQFLSITGGTSSQTIPPAIRWGVYAGVFVELLNMPTLSFVLESAYEQKGRTVTAAEVADSANGTAGLSSGPAGATPRLDYVHLAMLMKLRAGKSGFVPYGVVGPWFAFRVGKGDDPTHLFDQFKKSDVGISLAAGMEIVPRRQPLFSLEVRWSPSFTYAYSSPTLTVKNQSVDLLLLLWL